MIFMVDLAIKNKVDLSIAFCMFTIGKVRKIHLLMEDSATAMLPLGMAWAPDLDGFQKRHGVL